ncbi:hypothetical protein CPAV1605_1210 [seawater metagenome]|uniref:Translation elongation factor EFTu-like domain-containing protein n=1 Tax=seawater metagenome TaxID=1561972 RepID=A0A5E8CL06_9ZZZZ
MTKNNYLNVVIASLENDNLKNVIESFRSDIIRAGRNLHNFQHIKVGNKNVEITNLPNVYNKLREKIRVLGVNDCMVLIVDCQNPNIKENQNLLKIANQLGIQYFNILVINSSSEDNKKIKNDIMDDLSINDIVFTCANSGLEIVSNLKDYFNSLPIIAHPIEELFGLRVNNFYNIEKKNEVIVTGIIEKGKINKNDVISVVKSYKIERIENNGKEINSAEAGQPVGMLLKGLEKDAIASGDTLVNPITFNQYYKANCTLIKNKDVSEIVYNKKYLIKGRNQGRNCSVHFVKSKNGLMFHAKRPIDLSDGLRFLVFDKTGGLIGQLEVDAISIQ